MGFKKAYASFRREVLYTLLTEFGIPMKIVMLITVYGKKLIAESE